MRTVLIALSVAGSACGEEPPTVQYPSAQYSKAGLESSLAMPSTCACYPNGDTCLDASGRTASVSGHRCAAGEVCQGPLTLITDADLDLGTCRRVCRTSMECAAGEYCRYFVAAAGFEQQHQVSYQACWPIPEQGTITDDVPRRYRVEMR